MLGVPGSAPARSAADATVPVVSRVVFTAVERFDPACGERWDGFVTWSGLTHLREAVTLDGSLCPSAFRELTTEDWNHNVHEDYKTDLFRDLDHVVKATAGRRVNVLALVEEPSAADVVAFVDPRFVFSGFDLVDSRGGISALLNCGGFDKAFVPADLSECGLVTDYAKARDVQDRLRTEHPEEHHARCALWAIWRKS